MAVPGLHDISHCWWLFVCRCWSCHCVRLFKIHIERMSRLSPLYRSFAKLVQEFDAASLPVVRLCAADPVTRDLDVFASLEAAVSSGDRAALPGWDVPLHRVHVAAACTITDGVPIMNLSWLPCRTCQIDAAAASPAGSGGTY